MGLHQKKRPNTVTNFSGQSSSPDIFSASRTDSSRGESVGPVRRLALPKRLAEKDRRRQIAEDSLLVQRATLTQQFHHCDHHVEHRPR
jgi:hypothetical protein